MVCIHIQREYTHFAHTTLQKFHKSIQRRENPNKSTNSKQHSPSSVLKMPRSDDHHHESITANSRCIIIYIVGAIALNCNRDTRGATKLNPSAISRSPAMTKIIKHHNMMTLYRTITEIITAKQRFDDDLLVIDTTAR